MTGVSRASAILSSQSRETRRRPFSKFVRAPGVMPTIPASVCWRSLFFFRSWRILSPTCISKRSLVEPSLCQTAGMPNEPMSCGRLVTEKSTGKQPGQADRLLHRDVIWCRTRSLSRMTHPLLFVEKEGCSELPSGVALSMTALDSTVASDLT